MRQQFGWLQQRKQQRVGQLRMQDRIQPGKFRQQEVRKVYVAVGATFEPYTYIDENNQPAGYDVLFYRRSTTAFHSMNSRLKTWNLPTFLLLWMQRRFPLAPSSLRRTRKERRSICLQMKVLPLTISVLYTKKEEMISTLLMIWLERSKCRSGKQHSSDSGNIQCRT